MNFLVRWRDRASTQLLAHLLRANDKPAMLAAAREVERRLERNPKGEGEGRGETHRLAFFRPFSVLYTIDEPNRTVYVEELK